MTTFREHHIRVSRTARFFLLGEPATARDAWFVLHGYRQLAGRFIGRFADLPGLEDGRRAVIAPEALNRFYVDDGTAPHGPEARVGAAWMTRADREHEIEDYVDYLDRVRSHVGAAAERAVVLGFSQGAESASRWAVLGATPPDELILWGGGLAADLDPDATGAALRGTTVTFVVGSQDRWAQGRSEEGMTLLREQGLEPRRVDYDGGHRVEPGVLAEHWP
jgi:predicted esterase